MSILQEGVFTDTEFDDVCTGIRTYMGHSDIIDLDAQIRDQLNYMEGHDGNLEFKVRPFNTNFDRFGNTIPHAIVVRVQISKLLNPDCEHFETVWCPEDFWAVRAYVHNVLIDNFHEGERWYTEYIDAKSLKRTAYKDDWRFQTSLFHV